LVFFFLQTRKTLLFIFYRTVSSKERRPRHIRDDFGDSQQQQTTAVDRKS